MSWEPEIEELKRRMVAREINEAARLGPKTRGPRP